MRSISPWRGRVFNGPTAVEAPPAPGEIRARLAARAPDRQRATDIRAGIAADGVAELRIYDAIDWLGVTADQIARELNGFGAVDEIRVLINSPGGDVFDGIAIYNLLAKHPAKITTRVDGIAASAASIIAMAGDRIVMGTGTFLMIHNAWGIGVGDANDMEALAAVLRQINGALVDIYAERTDLGAEELGELLDAETWLTASEAVALGFADDVATAPKASALARLDLSAFAAVPDAARARFGGGDRGVVDPTRPSRPTNEPGGPAEPSGEAIAATLSAVDDVRAFFS